MKMLGLNPSDQELLDIPNKISKNGFIYYPDFCQLCLEYFRQEPEEEEDFRRNMFKVGIMIHFNINTVYISQRFFVEQIPIPRIIEQRNIVSRNVI